MFFVEVFIYRGDYWEFFMKYAATPRLILEGQGAGALSGITSLFLHSDIFHLLGNMLALWVFGRRVEDACGSLRFLGFYLLAGSSANILYVLAQHDSLIPSIGASGAIFGLMGAYLLLYPEGRIRILFLLSFVPLWPRVRAIWIVLYFVGIQIIPALQILFSDADYQVNHWAHLGGFFSAVFVLLFLRPEAFARYVSDTQV
jgi:membrane associated rhomboid family serine protease